MRHSVALTYAALPSPWKDNEQLYGGVPRGDGKTN